MEFSVRAAERQEVPLLEELIAGSARVLQRNDYSPEQIEAALRTVYGVDSQLIADGTYLVVTTAQGDIVACGGWSKRATLYGGDRWSERPAELLDPLRDAAKIRAFFIHQAWGRQGIGTLLLAACEQAARAAGFTRCEMGATLTGAKLFATQGYIALERIEIPLEPSITLPIIRMEKGRI